MTLQALPYIVLLGVLFGSTLVASRYGVGQFSPLAYIGLQLLIASVGHAAIYLAGRGRRWPTDRKLWFHAALLGVVGTAVPMVTITSALQYQSSTITAIFITASPALTVLVAHFFLPDERLTLRKALGIALAFAGALFIALRGESGLPDISRASPLGYTLVLLGMSCGSVMAVYARRFMRAFNAFDVASARMFVATVVVLPAALASGLNLEAVNGRGFLALGYAGTIGTFAGLMLAFHIVQRFGATAAAMPAYVIPVVATLGGVLLLGETVTAGMMAGMLLIVVGIAVLNQRAPAASLPAVNRG